MTKEINIVSIINDSSIKKGYKSEIGAVLEKERPMIVVLDDDPTGTQTVHGISVVTNWSQETIDKEFSSTEVSVFFILTNSRSFRRRKAYEVAKTIAERVRVSSQKFHRKVMIVSRGDSTLRGHYQAETEALEIGLDLKDCKQFLVPAFFEGGRYTIDDIHYMKNDDGFIPVGESPFAKDNTFGYQSSNLKEWISEKTDYKILKEDVYSFSLSDLRDKGPKYITDVLKEHQNVKYFIVNATCYEDLESFALGYLNSGLPAVIRSSASFVNAIANISKKPLLENNSFENTVNGGLTIVGSYVPKTTEQLNKLMEDKSFAFYEIRVNEILLEINRVQMVKEACEFIDVNISKNKEVVIYTSRAVKKGINGDDSLQIVNKVSACLIEIVKGIKVTPKYILTKGGITSSDIAVESLGVKKAIVQGQIIPGVPVWRLGKETKFPNVPYIIFPGNVGDSNALTNALTKLR
jgi:uncharacterized protein YgbK (DUF1537 family)